MERVDIFHRVYWRLMELGDDRLGEKHRSFIDEYHHELERLTAIGEDVSEFYMRPDDWSPQRVHDGPGGISYYSERLTGDGNLVVTRTRFERRFRPALQYVYRRIRHEEAKITAEQPAKPPSAVVEERSRLMAMLIDAYLRSQESFLARASDGQVKIYHPGLPGNLIPNWSHVEALAHEGRLILSPSAKPRTWTISIPTHVIEAVEAGVPDISKAPAGQRRLEDIRTQVINNFYGGSHNVAAGSSNVNQTITQGVRPADLPSLLAALRELGVGEAELDTLETMIESPEPEDADRTVGERARA